MNNKKPLENDTRKLILVVVYMAILVLLLFGLGPDGTDEAGYTNNQIQEQELTAVETAETT